MAAGGMPRTVYIKTDNWLIGASSRPEAGGTTSVRSLALAPPPSSGVSSFHRDAPPAAYGGSFTSTYSTGKGGSLATSYRSPYRSKQPAFFRGTTSFTAAAAPAADQQQAPAPAADDSAPAEEGTPPEPRTPVKGEAAPMTPVTARAFGQYVEGSAPYVSPFRSSAPTPLASPGRTSIALLQSGSAGSGVARWTSLSVSQGSSSVASSNAFGGARAAVGAAGAVAERRERQAYEEERLEERRQKRAAEQRKRDQELEETIFGSTVGGSGRSPAAQRSGGSSLRTASARAAAPASPTAWTPVLRWGHATVPATAPFAASDSLTGSRYTDVSAVSASMQRPMRSVAPERGAQSAREAARAEQRLVLTQQLQLQPSAAGSAAAAASLRLDPQPQPEPEPEPEPEYSQAAMTPPGPPPAAEESLAAPSPPVLSAFTIVREQPDGSTTPPVPPPFRSSPAADPTGAESVDQLDQARKVQRAERRAALGALISGLEMSEEVPY